MLAPKEMSRHMNNIYGSESRPAVRKQEPQRLGKRQREDDDADHPDPRRKRTARQEQPVSPIKHNFRPPKEPGYYKQLSGYGHLRD